MKSKKLIGLISNERTELYYDPRLNMLLLVEGLFKSEDGQIWTAHKSKLQAYIYIGSL